MYYGDYEIVEYDRFPNTYVEFIGINKKNNTYGMYSKFYSKFYSADIKIIMVKDVIRQQKLNKINE